MSEPISLGGERFEIRPLKLGQLRGLLDALDALPGKTGGALIDSAAALIVAGLAPAHPDLTVDTLLDLPITVVALNETVATILRIAGLQSGEALPVAIPAPNSGGSMALSPPAAVSIIGPSTS